MRYEVRRRINGDIVATFRYEFDAKVFATEMNAGAPAFPIVTVHAVCI
jgi:hypothetical protein